MRQIVKFVENIGRKVIFKFTGVIPKLEKDEEYVISIKPITKDRTLEQNKMMWSIIQTIADMTGQDIWEVYITGLKKYFKRNNVKGEFLMTVPDAEDRLKSVYRLVIKLEERLYNGKTLAVFECFYGSSTFNTVEMTDLIDLFLDEYYRLTE